MRILLTLIFAGIGYTPLTRLWMESSLFAWMASLLQLSPNVAQLAGVQYFWPVAFWLGCFALAGLVLNSFNFSTGFAAQGLHKASTSGASAKLGVQKTQKLDSLVNGL
jgi:hypothetical protein